MAPICFILSSADLTFIIIFLKRLVNHIFAFDVMSFPEDDIDNWQVPVYIDEGLKWLEKPIDKEVVEENVDATGEEE